jgi:ribonuclease R
MTGRNTGLTFTLGQAVEVQLVSATPRTGGMVFRLMQGDPRAAMRRTAGRGQPHGKPSRGRPLSRRR